MRNMLMWCMVLMGLFVPALADTVWHCSRSAAVDVSDDSIGVDLGDQFLLTAQGGPSDVINITLRDLMDVYSGVYVDVSGITLSACFMPVSDTQTLMALKALGLNSDVFSALARKSAITKSPLYRVRNELQMRECIVRHQPAVGYLSKPLSTEEITPCF